MKNDTRSELLNLATQHGERFWIDAEKCRAILNDVGKMFSKREIFALVSAVSLGLPKIIKSETSPTPWAVRRLQYLKTMQEDTGIQEQTALWSLDGWAIALRKIKVDQLTSESLDAENELNQVNSTKTDSPCVGKSGGRELFIQVKRISKKDGYAVIDFEVFNRTILNFTLVELQFTVFDADGYILDKGQEETRNVRPGKSVGNLIELSDINSKKIAKLFITLLGVSKVDCKWSNQIEDEKTIEELKASVLTCESLVATVPVECTGASIFELMDD